MKVAVLGANEAALVALDAITSRGDMEAVLVVPWDVRQLGVTITPSPLNELNFGYPGVPEVDVDFHIWGDRDWHQYRKDLYRAGLKAKVGTEPRTSSYRIFERIKPLLNQVTNITWVPEQSMLSDLLDRTVGGVDALINTMDRAHFCQKEDGEHLFQATRLWWSPSKGQKISPNQVFYNTQDAPAWAMTSNIDDRNITVWDHCPPFDDIYVYDVPTKMACSCESPGIDLHLGSWATYRPQNMAETYEEAVEFLHHPLAKINMENADTVPQEVIDDDQSPSDS